MEISHHTAWKVFQYGVFSSSYFPAFGLNTERYFNPNAGKYGPEKTPYLDTFHAVPATFNIFKFLSYSVSCPNSLHESLTDVDIIFHLLLKVWGTFFRLFFGLGNDVYHLHKIYELRHIFGFNCRGSIEKKYQTRLISKLVYFKI